MMRFLFNPDDWLGQNQEICLMLIAVLVLIESAL